MGSVVASQSFGGSREAQGRALLLTKCTLKPIKMLDENPLF